MELVKLTGALVCIAAAYLFASQTLDMNHVIRKLCKSVSSVPYAHFLTDSTICRRIKDKSSLTEYSEIYIYKLGMLNNEDERELKLKGFHQHGFNELLSEKVGLVRNVPDARNPVCKDKEYDKQLPTASVVMNFHNEAWSTLLRSVHSIIRQTPVNLLKEIILLDDKSSLDHLGQQLEDYIAQNLTKVRLLRSNERLGLIRARIAGARNATGEVLVFLDSHIEAGESWLEPLLDRIARNRQTVVVPVVDTIEAETMVYRKADLMRGGFTWSLLHNWEQLPQDVLNEVNVNAEPFITPTMPGGLFAIDRNYFHELGEYDSGMDIWGGENLEISFRIWQCGGRMEIVPCSRVGHVFRSFRPYSSPSGEDTATKNTARVAHVWLDEYKKHFFELRPKARTMNYGDVSDRVELRKHLKCKSFKWFLETIHPEQIVPGEKPKVPGAYRRPREKKEDVIVAEGKLKQLSSGLCGHPKESLPSKGSGLLMSDCNQVKSKTGIFILNQDNQIKVKGQRFCLETSDDKKGTNVYLMKCHSGGGPQTWLIINNHTSGSVLFNPASGLCLSEKNGKVKMDFCSSQTAQGFTITDK